MYRAIGQYQITNELTLSDFTFFVHSIHQDLTNSTTRIHVRYNTSNERYFTVQGILSPTQAIAEVKTWYNHEVISEQAPESVEVTQTTLRDLQASDMMFGAKLVQEFGIDNREIGTTQAQDIAMYVALENFVFPAQMNLPGQYSFNTIMHNGYIQMGRNMLQIMLTKSEIDGFGYQRINKYLTLINNYLMQTGR